jgi:predicted CXXCH cytochrome family protein
MRIWFPITASLLIVLAQAEVRAEFPPPTPPASAQIEFFESKIRPVLVNECYRCHRRAGSSRENCLSTREADAQGWESDQPAIVPGGWMTARC